MPDIIHLESKRYEVISGEFEGRKCTIFDPLSSGGITVLLEGGNPKRKILIEKENLSLLDVPGWDAYYQNLEGEGKNPWFFRSELFSQPRKLKKGDMLADGKCVIREPRMGYNGSALICLDDPGWIELAPRFPVALAGNQNYKYPAGLVAANVLATKSYVIKSFQEDGEKDWVSVYLDWKDCCFEIPHCVPLALAIKN